MDNQHTDQSLFSLRINENAKTQLRGAATVAGIAAILSLVTSILKVITAFISRPKTEYRYEGFGNDSRLTAQTTDNAGSAIFGLIITILLFYFLNRFANQTKTGLNGNNPQLINSGLGGLSGYLITIGVIVIICLVLVLVVVAGAASGGMK